jgi:YD repeat-containing protein
VITTVALTGGTSQATSYTFDNAGHQTAVTDAATGQSWTSGYNLLGQVTSSTTPDSGTTTMGYDGNGNLTQAADARGKTMSFTYDALNRKTAEYDTTTTGQSGSNVRPVLG